MTHLGTIPTRIDAVRRGLSDVGASVGVFGLSSNLRYLTGFSDEPGERMLLLIVPCDGEAALIVPRLYADQIDAASPAASLHVWADGENPDALLTSIAERLRHIPGQVLLDDALWATFALRVQAAFPGRSFGLASVVMTPLRERKDEAELAAMKRAGVIADSAYEAVTGEPICGLTELELARRLEAAMLSAGAEGIAFETLIASGPHSALPHYRAGTRKIESGDVVILDYGCRVDGYCSDITRTVVCGRSFPELERVHDALERAQRVARDRVEEGVRAQEVDAAARDVLVEAGYGEQFTHRTGHGIGLDVHESPYIVDGNQQRLGVGMAFSVEPGAYFAGAYGARIEDVVVVTEDGARAMTHAPHELKSVE
jgi:Xaa-Pro aminopeptidase